MHGKKRKILISEWFVKQFGRYKFSLEHPIKAYRREAIYFSPNVLLANHLISPIKFTIRTRHGSWQRKGLGMIVSQCISWLVLKLTAMFAVLIYHPDKSRYSKDKFRFENLNFQILCSIFFLVLSYKNSWMILMFVIIVTCLELKHD